ncbi:AlkP superfamily (GpmI) (PDB:1EJJ) [Commensalibacter communis]|uniref:2,3-bisphosphoglycerate-independent phosphoglycerate mutase n=1 Tax=Commensalibacter communis TaxID=2972786 RepID=UPI0022FFAC3A|nr:2,3-bisphosphoglycerate-independent phosphoglycerate mutase [Commensalibacter communis]CAI3926394.1 AlkP superfamily (GpmI) (PDB:1EJJ) [Commensalibacter communis]CAI3932977.1 AlkP superfamily (GpmI) (PDB:1EJJ) [Commensalibacter communis]
MTQNKYRPVMLTILDGFGYNPERKNNAIANANTPNLDYLLKECPHALLEASGEDVGLPDGQMGNSEVGHMGIGAGRIIMQELPKIGKAVKDGSILQKPLMVEFIDTLKKNGGTCHLLGLFSPGGVHAHQDHAVGLAKSLHAAGIKVALHIFTDGRDTPPESAKEFVTEALRELPKEVKVATVSGRYYAMDRDKRWDRVQKAYDALISGEGPHKGGALSAITDSYDEKITDEFILPTVISDYQGMQDGDGILSFNFRADRIRQLMNAFLFPDFDGFTRSKIVKFSKVLGMTQYSDVLTNYMGVLFPPESIDNVLGEVVSKAGLKQLRSAETEKYPHVTYFLNGGREEPFPGEDRILVNSPKVATYDLQPEMSAPELTSKIVEAINSQKYDLIVVNFANPDMVGHTGMLDAAIKAVEAIDQALGEVVKAIKQQSGALIITADHGNCEIMVDPVTGEPHTQHTLDKVPVILAGVSGVKLHDGRLADLAPTLLHLMNLPQPKEMTGKTLISE